MSVRGCRERPPRVAGAWKLAKIGGGVVGRVGDPTGDRELAGHPALLSAEVLTELVCPNLVQLPVVVFPWFGQEVGCLGEGAVLKKLRGERLREIRDVLVRNERYRKVRVEDQHRV